MHHTVAHKHPHHAIHGHAWLVGLAGLALGLVLLVYVPTIPAVAASLLLFAAFHLVGALLVLASAYVLLARRWLRRLRPAARSADRYDFGWGPEWMNGLALAALATGTGALAIAVAAPGWWPLGYALIALALCFAAGNGVMRSFRSLDHVVLPMVKLFDADDAVILDAGCGSGRTMVALSRILGRAHIVGVDRFDADYIDDGGRPQIEHNLRLAGIRDQVELIKADLTDLPFPAGHFDAAVSTHVFDHLGAGKPKAMAEIARVLKPGGRFLMAVWVPGWAMFFVANVLSWLFTSPAGWRSMAEAAGLTVVDQGRFNYAWFAVFEKPANPT